MVSFQHGDDVLGAVTQYYMAAMLLHLHLSTSTQTDSIPSKGHFDRPVSYKFNINAGKALTCPNHNHAYLQASQSGDLPASSPPSPSSLPKLHEDIVEKCSRSNEHATIINGQLSALCQINAINQSRIPLVILRLTATDEVQQQPRLHYGVD